MPKLNQIIAIQKGIKSQNYAKVGELHKLSQKHELFVGQARTYKSLNDEGDKLPSESKRVQVTVDEMWRTASRLMTEAFDVEARREWTNSIAFADIVVDDKTILAKVPVGYLLFLEKQMNDIRTLVEAYPELDQGEEWELDKEAGIYKTEPAKTHRTKKIQKTVVLLQPTEHHPGQAELVTEDVIEGHWTIIKHSGAMPRTEKAELLDRVEKLSHAIKMAREEANNVTEVPAPKVGNAIFSYLSPE